MIGSTSLPFRLLVGLFYLFLLAPILPSCRYRSATTTISIFRRRAGVCGGMRKCCIMKRSFRRSGSASALHRSSPSCRFWQVSWRPMPSAVISSRREAVLNFFTAPFLPSIVLGLAILLVFVCAWNCSARHRSGDRPSDRDDPYVIRIMITAFSTLPPSAEEAATMLGASPPRKHRITLLLMMPGLVASVGTFLLSFDEVVISLFITGPRMTTLPVEIFNYVESCTDPMTASISVVLIAATLLIIFVIERTLIVTHNRQITSQLKVTASMENIALWMSQPHFSRLSRNCPTQWLHPSCWNFEHEPSTCRR